jgi:hypothetical protein
MRLGTTAAYVARSAVLGFAFVVRLRRWHSMWFLAVPLGTDVWLGYALWLADWIEDHQLPVACGGF